MQTYSQQCLYGMHAINALLKTVEAAAVGLIIGKHVARRDKGLNDNGSATRDVAI